MRFILLRHAHKGVLPIEDPELSPPGFEQAILLAELIKNNKLTKPTHLYASPKRRTSQTLYPTSKNLNIKIEIQAGLDQQNQTENTSDFRSRIQQFLQHIQSRQPSNDIILACTHYDWIEHAMGLINCDKDLNSFEFSSWSPAQYIEFILIDGLWSIIRKGHVKGLNK